MKDRCKCEQSTNPWCTQIKLGVRLTAEEYNMGICLEVKTQILAWQVDSPPWQCPCVMCQEFASP
jgi:hypothetical protein